MTTHQNKDVVRQWVESGWNRGDFSAMDELYTADYLPNWMLPGFPKSAEGLRQFVTTFRQGMPDLHLAIEDMVADGDRVAWRFTATGTHTGELLGIPLTNRPVNADGIVIARFEGGRYGEDWVNFDQLGMFQQLGVIPDLAPVGA
jgi:steroid delta-isomerase-like uncharacterized protein